MAQEVTVTLTDDLDGGSADETVMFALDGVRYQIDLSEANAAAFRRVLGPWVSKARPCEAKDNAVVLYVPRFGQGAGFFGFEDAHQQGQPLALAAAGTMTPIGYLPTTPTPSHPYLTAVPIQPADSPTQAEEETAGATLELATEAAVEPAETKASTPVAEPTVGGDDAAVRAWANLWSVPCNERGRVAAKVRAAYQAFQDDNRDLWKELLKEAGISPRKAANRAAKLLTDAQEKAAQEAAGPTQQERDRKAARQIRTLTAPQLSRLRAMVNAPEGRATSDGRPTDKASFDALCSRELCTNVGQSDDGRPIYEITSVGRVWFDVHNTPTHE